MRYALIEDGKIINITKMDPNNIPSGFENWEPCGNAGIGWLRDGGGFTAPPDPAPSEDPQDYPLQAWQFHAMLEEAGLDTQIRGAINAMADGVAKKVAMQKFERTPIFNRNDPLMLSLSAGLGLTPEQVDALWMQAKDLK